MAKWQDVSKLLGKVFLFKKRTRSRTLWISGSGSLVAIIVILTLLTGVSIETSGDIVCGDKCESYFNISTSYWRICFSDTFNPVFVDAKGVRTELYVPTYGKKWRLFNPKKDCIERKKINKFKIVGYKNPYQTVKWGVHLNTIFKDYVDPVWFGTPAGNLTLRSGESEVDEDMFLLWHLNDGSLLDSTSFGNNGTAQGGIDCTDDEGRFFEGCSFDGSNDYISGIPHVNLSTDLTISLWLNVNAVNIVSAMVLVDSTCGQYEKGSLSVKNNQIKFRDCADDGSDELLSSTIVANEWYHFSLVRNGTDTTFYIDGEFDKLGVSIYGPRMISGLGGPPGAGNEKYFNGTIDELVFYNRSLSASEIANIYNKRKPLHFLS